MKKILLLIAVALTIVGCSKSEDIPQPSEPETGSAKEYIVSFGLTCEDVIIEESPLTKSTSNDLYGIQVYSCPTGQEYGSYSSYAYGLFDNTESMKIRLMDGYKYKFVCTLVVDGKNIISYSETNGYSTPFQVSTFSTTLNNSFTYSTSKQFDSLYSSAVRLKNGNYVVRPEIERYAGEITDYIPAENSPVMIDLKKAIFGVKVIAEEFTEGKVKFVLDQSNPYYITFPETSLQITPSMSMGMFSAHSGVLMENIRTEIYWEKNDGSSILLMSKYIEYKRNTLTTITVKIADNSINSGIDFSKENSAMTNGENIVIDGGGTDTDITPK